MNTIRRNVIRLSICVTVTTVILALLAAYPSPPWWGWLAIFGSPSVGAVIGGIINAVFYPVPRRSMPRRVA